MKPENAAASPPTKCTICNSSRRQKIEDSILDGTPRDEVIARFGLSRSSFDRHRGHMPGTPRIPASKPPPAPPRIPASGSARDFARMQCEWLSARLQWLHETGAPERDIGRVVGQYSAAIRTLSKLEADDKQERGKRFLTYWAEEAYADFIAAEGRVKAAGERGESGQRDFIDGLQAAILAACRFLEAPKTNDPRALQMAQAFVDYLHETHVLVMEIDARRSSRASAGATVQ